MSDIRIWATRVLAILLLMPGAWLILGGTQLVSLGGSWYYLIAGFVISVGAGLVWRQNSMAISLFSLLVIGSTFWALTEVGTSFWLLIPRIGLPVGLLLILLFWCLLTAGSHQRSHIVVGLSAVTVSVTALAISAVSDRSFEITGSAGESRAEMWSGMPELTGIALNSEEWRHYGKTQAGSRYIHSDQINTSNVADLEVAWMYRTGDRPEAYPQSTNAFAFQATPLKIDETLYFCTPHNIVIALDATTGREKWRHDPDIATQGIYMLACRGVSYHEDTTADGACARRIILATLDARLLALDAETGASCAGFGEGGETSLLSGLGQVKPGYYLVSSPPTVVGDVAVVGGFVLDNMSVDEPPGVVRGYSVKTGEQLWAWDSGRPDHAGPWLPGEAYTRGSPNAWSLFSADEALGLVYVPTGNATPDYYGGLRTEAQDRYSSSIVALDSASGEVRWSFQTVHHDLWDYDVGSQPTLIDIPMGGTVVPALLQPTKQGEIYLLDRRSGEPIANVQEQAVPQGDVPGERYALTQPVSSGMPSLVPPPLTEADMWGITSLDQLWCRIEFKKLRYEGRFTPPGLDPTLSWPGNMGVSNWGSASVDLVRGLLAVNTSYAPLIVQLIPRHEMPEGEQIFFDERFVPLSPQTGTPYGVKTERPMLSPLGVPCNAPPWGRLSVINLKNRQLLWQRALGTSEDHAPLGIPVPGAFSQGGTIVTQGGLIFVAATQDDYIRAFDIETGRELWKSRLPAGGQATPMSYISKEDGKQYVVIAAGGHQYMQTTIGDYLIAFSLAGSR